MQNKIIPTLNIHKTVEIINSFIKDKLNESNSKGFVIGLSGGIDSSLVAYLCARAVGSDKIFGLVLPSDTTSSECVKDAVKVAEKLGIKYKIFNIDHLIKPFPKLCSKCSKSNLANANLNARIRMILLYYHSNAMQRIVVGTGNRTELLVGYFTKYGDGGVDILPIGDLYKTEVYEVADYAGVPKNIIEKSPTAGLWAGQTDEEELGIKYELLDRILYLIVDEGLSIEKVSNQLEITYKEVLRIKKMIESSKHKLFSPCIAKLR